MELARRLVKTEESILSQHVLNASQYISGEACEELPTLPFIPYALLHDLRELIWNVPAGAAWDVKLSAMKLLAGAVASLLGLPWPYNPERVGQRMSDALSHKVNYDTYEKRLSRAKDALRQRLRREQQRDGASSKAAATGADDGAPSAVELVELATYAVSVDSDGWSGDATPNHLWRRQSGSAASSIATHSCNECAMGRPREAALLSELETTRAALAKAEATAVLATQQVASLKERAGRNMARAAA